MRFKEKAKEGLKLFAIGKGLKMSGGLLKAGAIAGAGYLAYNFYKKKKGKQ